MEKKKTIRGKHEGGIQKRIQGESDSDKRKKVVMPSLECVLKLLFTYPHCFTRYFEGVFKVPQNKINFNHV